MKALEVYKGFLSAKVVGSPIPGLVISVYLVAISSSEIFIRPSSVTYILSVGIVCPNCRGHLVPIIQVGSQGFIV